MPRKAQYTKEEVVAAALDLVREKGAERLTAREMGRKIGTSVVPVFSLFGDMGTLRREVSDAAKNVFDGYMREADDYEPTYKKRGMQWVKFASEEKELFKFLFMQPTGLDLDGLLDLIPFGKDRDIDVIMRDYGMSTAEAEHLFKQMWIYTYGLCVLTASGSCSFSEKEISLRLAEIFSGTVGVIKSGSTLTLVPTHR